MKRGKVFAFLFLAVLSVSFVFAASINSVATGYRMAGSSSVQIEAHNICKVVGNDVARIVFIPTNTSVEWNAFLDNKPYGITIDDCAPEYTYEIVWGAWSTCYAYSQGGYIYGGIKYRTAKCAQYLDGTFIGYVSGGFCTGFVATQTSSCTPSLTGGSSYGGSSSDYYSGSSYDSGNDDGAGDTYYDVSYDYMGSSDYHYEYSGYY